MYLKSTQPKEVPHILPGMESRYGPLTIQVSEKDEVYQQILQRRKEFVTWVPPVNILQGLDYLKIELHVAGISKDDCELGNAGVSLWIKIRKGNLPGKSDDIFHWTFVLPKHLIAKKSTAFYGPDGKLVIIVPKEKSTDAGLPDELDIMN